MIGDIYQSGAQSTVDAIKKSPSGSREAHWKRCDVTNWEEQVALFEFAVSKFGGVDIVVSVVPVRCVDIACTDLVHTLRVRMIDRWCQGWRNSEFRDATGLGWQTR